MRLIPTEEEVLDILRRTGAVRDGHFEFPSGLHGSQLVQMPLAMRYYRHAKTLSVGLSRLIRANPELRALIPELSIVAPATGGLPVAFGVCEALQAHQVYWAERENRNEPLGFRPHLEQTPGEPVVLVDDLMRSGKKLKEMQALLESRGAKIVALAAIVSQPTPDRAKFEDLPYYQLATVPSAFHNAEDCELCRKDIPLEKVSR